MVKNVSNKPSPQKGAEARAAFWFLAPGYGLYLLFALIPALATVIFSLAYIDRYTWSFEYVGLENIIYVLTDKRFWTSFVNTFYFVALAAVGNVGLGLIFAAILDRALPKVVLYVLRLAFFLPVLVSTALVSLVWQFIYSSDLGALNYYITAIGLPRIGWLSDERVAMVAVVIMDVWKHFGFFMIILLAALQSVPRELTEAAEIDGAGPGPGARHPRHHHLHRQLEQLRLALRAHHQLGQDDPAGRHRRPSGRHGFRQALGGDGGGHHVDPSAPAGLPHRPALHRREHHHVGRQGLGVISR